MSEESTDFVRPVFVSALWAGFLRQDDAFFDHGIVGIKSRMFCRLAGGKTEELDEEISGKIEMLRAACMEALVHHMYLTARPAGEDDSSLIPVTGVLGKALEGLEVDVQDPESISARMAGNAVIRFSGRPDSENPASAAAAPYPLSLFGWRSCTGILPIEDIGEYRELQADTADTIVRLRREIGELWPVMRGTVSVVASGAYYYVTPAPRGEII